jgi:hypothetical protein
MPWAIQGIMSITSSIKDFFSPLPKKKVDFRPSLFKKKDIIDVPPVPSLPSGVVSSGFTPDILRDALNDAKAVRATALANAHQALTNAFDANGIKPAPSVYKPGYKIDLFEDIAEIGKFDDDRDDFVSAISGFQLNIPNKNNNSYNNISFTASYHAPPPFSSLYGGTKVDSHGNPLPSALQDLLSAGLPQAKDTVTKVDTIPLDKIDKKYGVDPSGAVDVQPKPRTGKIARVEFDVVIGRPQWSNQIHAIKNSLGKEIYLASNHEIVRKAINIFNGKLNEMYRGKTPVFTIENGTMFKTGLIDEPNPALDFHFLRFPNNGAKISAVFSYGESNRLKDIIEVKKQLELIGSSCQFYILGEMELDEQEENLTEMVIESFGYNNPHRMNVNKELFRIL